MILAILFVTALAIGAFVFGNLLRRKRNANYIVNSMENLFEERYQMFEQILTSNLIQQKASKNKLAELDNLLSQMKNDDLNTDEIIAIENRTSERLNLLLKDFPDNSDYTEIDKLQALWNAAELRFSDARKAYNNAAVYYNYSIDSFPTKYLAKILNYMPKAMLNELTDTNSIVEDLTE